MANCPHCGAPLANGADYCSACGCRTVKANSGGLSDDARDNRKIAILSYIGPLCFIPYAKAKRSPFAHYHSVRGLNLFILEAAYLLVQIVLGILVNNVFGAFLALLLWLGWGFFVFLSVNGISHVLRGLRIDLPFVGKLRIVKE